MAESKSDDEDIDYRRRRHDDQQASNKRMRAVPDRAANFWQALGAKARTKAASEKWRTFNFNVRNVAELRKFNSVPENRDAIRRADIKNDSNDIQSATFHPSARLPGEDGRYWMPRHFFWQDDFPEHNRHIAWDNHQMEHEDAKSLFHEPMLGHHFQRRQWTNFEKGRNPQGPVKNPYPQPMYVDRNTMDARQNQRGEVRRAMTQDKHYNLVVNELNNRNNQRRYMHESNYDYPEYQFHFVGGSQQPVVQMEGSGTFADSAMKYIHKESNRPEMTAQENYRMRVRMATEYEDNNGTHFVNYDPYYDAL